MSEFKVGEVAILVCPDIPNIHGSEVTITGELAMRECRCVRTGRDLDAMCYQIIGVPGYGDKTVNAKPSALRKKRPPEEQTTWQAVQSITGWNPHGVPA